MSDYIGTKATLQEGESTRKLLMHLIINPISTKGMSRESIILTIFRASTSTTQGQRLDSLANTNPFSKPIASTNWGEKPAKQLWALDARTLPVLSWMIMPNPTLPDSELMDASVFILKITAGGVHHFACSLFTFKTGPRTTLLARLNSSQKEIAYGTTSKTARSVLSWIVLLRWNHTLHNTIQKSSNSSINREFLHKTIMSRKCIFLTTLTFSRKAHPVQIPLEAEQDHKACTIVFSWLLQVEQKTSICMPWLARLHLVGIQFKQAF